MFCPKCATPNPDGGSFCRGCGANISLVPQALTGQLPTSRAEEISDRHRRRHGRNELTLDRAFKNMFLGVAFLIISIVLSRSGVANAWWFWMLIPAFLMMGSGIGQFIRLREKEKRELLQAPPVGRAFPERTPNTDQLMAPVPSVTEGTTRHLGVEAPTRHLDANERK